MAEVSVTAGTLRLDNLGNLKLVSAQITSIDNDDTWTVPHIREIVVWGIRCTTDDDTEGTLSGNVITFKNGAQLAGRVWALGW